MGTCRRRFESFRPDHFKTRRNNHGGRRYKGLKIVGVTDDGQYVISGVFLFHSSVTGLPLDVIIEKFKEENYVVDWCSFVSDALKGGWSPKRILDRVESGLVSNYGIVYTENVISRIKKLFLQL